MSHMYLVNHQKGPKSLMKSRFSYRMREIFAKNYLKFWTQSKTKKENLKRTICHRFDSYYYEDYDIATKYSNTERTFAIDTVIYILNRLFKFHQEVLDSGWIELTTPHTKKT
ncbi:hypothetical protein RclHR1_00170023 [Rhizophagus clarus]|uniref:Uncharacterized protein n=1 Tax=Rhizophagus clarus TaxID=94130 RepID=A0A2Z6QWG1_9GLOM|nr:hypothetical protein RclHR1_00170023 [Rhizophagus clarus]